MRPWERFPSSPKKPPPAHGIKAKKPGLTWWGQRWLSALERISEGYAGRLARGRSYARAGRTHDLLVEPGRVTAKVTGSRAEPYDVTIELVALSEAQWDAAIARMTAKAQFAAELLGGQMPKDIDEAFHAAGASLFPSSAADLVTHCSCPDWANPCKHVAATHYVLGDAFDRDPFLLFELRGKNKQRVLNALRLSRSGRTRAAKGRAERRTATAKVRLGKLSAADYDKPRGALPALRFSFEEPSAPAIVLRQLGAPASWQGSESPADVLAPLLHAAADKARRLALAEPEAAQDTPASEQPTLLPHTRDERTKRRPRAGRRRARPRG
jgi:uncharacterized Zn finger protein